ncbi:MAG: UDP-N-acetylglucosamine 1-carboxyvinyltransferase [Patescibacteria group bacterium]
MEKLVINGGKKLHGSINVKGAKNCALKVMAASLLTDGVFNIKNVPEIEDVFRLQEILKDLGCKAKRHKKGEWSFQADNIHKIELDKNLVPKLRSSVLLIGPLLTRFKKVKMPHPGGCAIGKRPIDIFISGFKTLGAKVKCDEQGYIFEAKQLIGAKLAFPKISVTGTETMMMAAVLAKGKTTLINSACEPEIKALADFLNSLGAKISGAGTPTIEINGVEKISGGSFTVIPDRIEAFSFLALAVATNSHLEIKKCNTEHLTIPLLVLKEMGVKMKIGNDNIKITDASCLTAVNVTTHEYPGFPTDCQSPLTVALTRAKGESYVSETIFEDRFLYTDFLRRMGADIQMINQQKISITGPSVLTGKKVESPDLRAGIAMVIAALMANGKTEIDNIYQIDRGYENIDARLRRLGADIKREKYI